MEYLHAVHKYFTPPPVSPLFQEGGALYGYNEDVTQFVVALVFMAILDRCIVRPFFVPKARYFALHAFINAAMVYLAFPDVWATFTSDPRGVFQGPMKSMTANSVLVAMHLYHCLAFKVTGEDIFHHVLFSFVVAPFIAAHKWHFGRAPDYAAFFLSGLPGGIDYVLLVLHYHGLVSRHTEKWWFAHVNVWIRSPGPVIFGFIAYLNWFHPTLSVDSQLPAPVAAGILALVVYNGQLYSRQAVESYTKFMEKQRIEASGSKKAE